MSDSTQNPEAVRSTVPANRTHLWFALAVAALLYLPSLFGEFVYDDHYLIQQNASLQSEHGFRDAFTQDYYGQSNPQYALGYYRPLALLTHWLDWRIWGDHPFGHHLTSLLLHLACTALLYLVLVRILRNEPVAFLASVCFAVHPAHVPTVSFVSGRVDALATLFALASLLFFCTRRAAAAPAYLAALLSKEISVTLPALAFWHEKDRGWRRAFLSMIPFAVVLAAVLLIRVFAVGIHRPGALQLTPAALAGAARALASYLRFLVFPPFRMYMEPSPWRMPLLPDLCAVAVFGLGVWFSRDRKTAGWSLVWLVTLLPVLGFVRIETALDERFLYLPSVAFCLLAADWAFRYLRTRNDGREPPEKQVLVAAALIAVLFAPLLIVKQAYWHNDLALWRSACETDPESGSNRLRLGVALLEAEDASGAEEQFREGLRLSRADATLAPPLLTHLATALQAQGKTTEVEALYRKALQLSPEYYTAHFNLGLYYKQAGRTREALDEFRAALRSNPNSPAARHNVEELEKPR